MVVLGGGTAGVNAAHVATDIDADVTILEVDFERMHFLDITMTATGTMADKVTCQPVAEAHGLAFEDPKNLLG